MAADECAASSQYSRIQAFRSDRLVAVSRRQVAVVKDLDQRAQIVLISFGFRSTVAMDTSRLAIITLLGCGKATTAAPSQGRVIETGPAPVVKVNPIVVRTGPAPVVDVNPPVVEAEVQF